MPGGSRDGRTGTAIGRPSNYFGFLGNSTIIDRSDLKVSSKAGPFFWKAEFFVGAKDDVGDGVRQLDIGDALEALVPFAKVGSR